MGYFGFACGIEAGVARFVDSDVINESGVFRCKLEIAPATEAS